MERGIKDRGIRDEPIGTKQGSTRSMGNMRWNTSLRSNRQDPSVHRGGITCLPLHEWRDNATCRFTNARSTIFLG